MNFAIMSASHQRTSDATGGVNPGETDEMHEPPSEREKAPLFFHGPLQSHLALDRILPEPSAGFCRMTISPL
jgi:hypothetical protein